MPGMCCLRCVRAASPLRAGVRRKRKAIVSATVDRPGYRMPHPAYAFLLAATVPPFLGAALSDYAYKTSAQLQWSNFSSWLIAGGLVFGGGALVFALARLLGVRRGEHPGARFDLSFLVLLATWVLGFINALIHARDAWAVMPTGFVLSVVVAVLACVAAWLGFSGRAGGVP